ncbi:MFS transporter [Blastopirellula sp. JC732]|uniref:MFS transporter n=1 Tax=Blastopirellula sediminis TaxID=2894196 RepID=A0A9X1MKZ1_9BACT|nr:MFS transporter [Blastopirellula sediminis]MCC9607783.1 MFS transporter [Blastopirellula sediminis]MCC9627424.1 MFS transporter [Blastopirellula sediminis]
MSTVAKLESKPPQQEGIIKPAEAKSESTHAAKPDWVVRAIPFFYGWMILPISMVAQFATSPGQTYGVSLFNTHFSRDLALSPLDVSFAYMWGTIIASLPMSLIGGIADRFGLRSSMTIVVLIFGGSCLFMSQVSGVWTLFLGFLLIRMFGQGALTLLATTSVDMWFRQRLGFAVGIRNLSMPIALALFPLMSESLIENIGWRMTYVVLGIGVCGLMLPLLFVFFRNKPEDIGQLPDGVKSLPAEPGDLDQKPVDPDLHLPQFTMGEALLTRSYWILVALMSCWAMIATALTFVMVRFLESRGLSEDEAPVIFLCTALTMAICQFIGGWLADHVRLHWLMAAGAVGLAMSVICYANINSVYGAALFGLVFGAAQGVAVSGASSAWARYFGRAHLGKIKGSSMTWIVAGSAAGPYLLNLGAANLGGYEPVLWLFTAIFASLAVACMFCTPPRVKYPQPEF